MDQLDELTLLRLAANKCQNLQSLTVSYMYNLNDECRASLSVFVCAILAQKPPLTTFSLNTFSYLESAVGVVEMLESCIDNNLTTLTEFNLSWNSGWKEDPAIAELITVIKA